MCDPLSAIALAGSAVAAGVNYEGQQATVAAQNQSNEDWVATQRAAAAKAAAADEVQRQKATASLNTAETALSPQNQTAVQQGAATDLNSQMLAGSPAASNSNVQPARRHAGRHIGQSGHGEPGHQRRQGGSRAHRGAGGHYLLRRRL